MRAIELIKKFKFELVERNGIKEIIFNSKVNPTAVELYKIKSMRDVIIAELEK